MFPTGRRAQEVKQQTRSRWSHAKHPLGSEKAQQSFRGAAQAPAPTLLPTSGGGEIARRSADEPTAARLVTKVGTKTTTLLLPPCQLRGMSCGDVLARHNAPTELVRDPPHWRPWISASTLHTKSFDPSILQRSTLVATSESDSKPRVAPSREPVGHRHRQPKAGAEFCQPRWPHSTGGTSHCPQWGANHIGVAAQQVCCRFRPSLSSSRSRRSSRSHRGM